MESGSLPEIEEINFTSSDNKSPIVNCDPPRGQQKWGIISYKQYPAAHRNLTSFCSSQTAMLSFLVPCESNLIVTTSLYNTLDTLHHSNPWNSKGSFLYKAAGIPRTYSRESILCRERAARLLSSDCGILYHNWMPLIIEEQGLKLCSSEKRKEEV